MKRKSLLVFPILLVASLASCSSGSSKGESAKKNNALMHPENLSVEVVDEFEIKTPKEFDYEKFYPRYMQAATSFGEDYNSITIGEIESMSSNNSKLQVMNYITEYTFAKNYFSGTSRRVIELDELKFVAEDSGDIYAHKDGHTYGKEIYGGEEYYYIDEEDSGDFLAHYKEQQTSLAMESHAMLSQFVEYAFYFYSQLF